MTYVVTENCIKCKTMDCVEVCPVDAILPDSAPELERWLKLNAEYAAVWPNVTTKREPAADFKEFIGVPEKFEKYFSRNPGQGD